MSAHAAEAGLAGFIAGVAVASVAGWFLRGQIRGWLARKRGG